MNLDLNEIDLSVQVSLSVLNLAELHLESGVSVEGLDELLNVIIEAIEDYYIIIFNLLQIFKFQEVKLLQCQISV